MYDTVGERRKDLNGLKAQGWEIERMGFKERTLIGPTIFCSLLLVAVQGMRVMSGTPVLCRQPEVTLPMMAALRGLWPWVAMAMMVWGLSLT